MEVRVVVKLEVTNVATRPPGDSAASSRDSCVGAYRVIPKA